LAAIIVRTDADVSTLKYLLQRDGLSRFIPLIVKSDGPGIFFSNFTAVQYVDTSPGRVSFQLQWTRNGADIFTEIEAFDSSERMTSLYSGSLKPLKKYYTTHSLEDGSYRIKFNLEGCYAHESIHILTST
jgi:hypothetical protein